MMAAQLMTGSSSDLVTTAIHPAYVPIMHLPDMAVCQTSGSYEEHMRQIDKIFLERKHDAVRRFICQIHDCWHQVAVISGWRPSVVR